MSKDSTNNVLYLLGVVGSIMAFINGIYYIAFGEVVPGGIDRLLMGGGFLLIGIALLGIYRTYGSYIAILAMLWSILYQIIGTILFGILGVNVINWILGAIFSFLVGYSFYLTRDKIGIYATVSGIFFIIWGFVNMVLKYLNFEATGDPNALNNIAIIPIAMAISAIYFILAIRSDES
ncbi:MAG: hypothetical protein ACFFEA_13430 [Candidatus Thorarchaeota archaeon]